MLISIVIPAFNEENRLLSYLDEVVSFFRGEGHAFEILVVDDGSSDQTALRVREYSAKQNAVRLIKHEKNLGKGAAVRTGMLQAKGEIRGFTDADGATPIVEVKRVLVHFPKGAKVVIGSRAKISQETRVLNLWHRKVMGRVFNFLLNQFVRAVDQEGKSIIDTQCGFKWFTAEAAQNIFSKVLLHGYAFDVEVLYLANRFQFPIVEQPVNWIERGDSRVNLLVDPLKMLLQVMKISRLHRGE